MKKTENEELNKAFTASYINYLINNRIEEFEELKDEFLEKNKDCVDFGSFAKNPLEKMIDEATGFEEQKKQSFKKFMEYIYELMWEEKINEQS